MGRRLKILRVSRELLGDIFKQNVDRQVVIVEGLPEDAELVGISEHAQFNRDEVVLKFESQQWPEVADGQAIEEVRILTRRIDVLGILNDALKGRTY